MQHCHKSSTIMTRASFYHGPGHSSATSRSSCLKAGLSLCAACVSWGDAYHGCGSISCEQRVHSMRSRGFGGYEMEAGGLSAAAAAAAAADVTAEGGMEFL